MGFDAALSRLMPPLLLFALGAGAMFAGIHELWANVVLALLLAAWTWGTIAVRARRDARTPPAPTLSPLLAEQAREQRRLTAYLNLSPAPLVTLDDERRLHAVNRAARRLFACEDRVPDPPAGLAAAIESAAPGRSASVRLVLAGEPRAFALATADLSGGGVGTRIAALVNIDAELRAAEASALRDLLQVLSHEIMNALTPIASLGRTAADMLAERAEPGLEPARDALETVARRAEGLQRFTTAYRDLARLPPPDLQRVELRPLLADLERMLTARWPGVRFTFDVDRAPHAVRADGDQLSAALWAMLQNAVEAIDERPDGVIELDCRSVVEGAMVTIRDNGPGIPPDVRDSVFRPFFTTKPAGSGVGLALVQQIIHAHQGSVALESSSAGTAFTISLPVV
ncbi:histidine kinase [Sphingomonas koreensis]|nr:histidine kinase [Sphingomonas koreensis]